MSEEDRAGIAKILNQTNYRVLAWYFNPRDTEKSGLRDFICLGRMQMQSTGNERFTVYVYFRTFAYKKGIEAAWDQYDEECDDDDSQAADDKKNKTISGEANDDDDGEGPMLIKASKLFPSLARSDCKFLSQDQS